MSSVREENLNQTLWAIVLPDNEVVLMVVHDRMPRQCINSDHLLIDLERRSATATSPREVADDDWVAAVVDGDCF